MAMTMQGEVALPADRATVWAALNNPEVLKAAIPGCQERFCCSFEACSA
jgi:carbon monoxide dehydrogenase subunit G